MKSSFFQKAYSSLLLLLFIFVFTNTPLKGADKQAVKRIYVNVSETEKIVAPKGIDDYMTSFAGVAKITQTSDKVLLVEAVRAGRTTITVVCGEEIYRYHLTTFDGRGADEAHVNNEFAAKGYNQLIARFDKVNKDQLLIEGKAATQEQLDDAVEIAKKYVTFVVLKAKIISDNSDDNEVASAEEREIEQTIEKIANVKGLRVKVKFEMRQKATKITESASTGNPIVTSSNTSSSGATSTTTAPLLPAESGGREPEPIKGSLEESTVQQLEGVPAKIFLFGRVKDDLQRAQAIRVARTFCQLVVSFLTVEDPIQIRFQAWIMDVNLTKARNLGVSWPNSLSYRALQGAAASTAGGAVTTNPLGAGATSVATVFSKMFSGGGESVSPMQNITSGLNTNVDIAVNLLETEGVGKIMQAPVIMVTNGQTGYFTTGGSFPVATSTSNLGVTTSSTAYQTFQTYIQILPLNLERSGPGGETIDILNSTNQKTIPTMMDAKDLKNPIGKNNFSLPPEIDDSLKMVDEYGNIGVRVNVGIESIAATNAVVSAVPTLENKTTNTRVIVRDGQPIILSGFYSKTFNSSKRKVPFFGDIPLIGGMFKNDNILNDDTREIIVVLKPTIVRLGSSTPETIFPESKTNEVAQMIHDIDPKVANKAKGKNEPYKSNAPSKKKALEPKENSSNNPNSVEQVPLIDVTPATPKMQPAEETPMIRRAEPIPPSESPSEIPQIIPESPTPAETPTPVNLQEESVVPVEIKSEEKSQEPTRMKEGPKTRVRPEAPDDSGLLKEQTKLRLRQAQQQAQNR